MGVCPIQLKQNLICVATSPSEVGTFITNATWKRHGTAGRLLIRRRSETLGSVKGEHPCRQRFAATGMPHCPADSTLACQAERDLGVTWKRDLGARATEPRSLVQLRHLLLQCEHRRPLADESYLHQQGMTHSCQHNASVSRHLALRPTASHLIAEKIKKQVSTRSMGRRGGKGQ